MDKIVTVIVTYNVSNLLAKQVELIRKFCKDDHDIVVVDNSTDSEKIEDIAYWCSQLNVERIKVFSAETSGSKSNAFACNIGYAIIRDRYRFFHFLDHDTFPMRDYWVTATLAGRAMAGIGQQKSKMYFQQTSLMFDLNLVDKNMIDFSVCEEHGLDTGGMLYKIIEHYGRDACVFFNEKYYENPYYRKGFYNFYATINDDMFMHFINGSNWNPTSDNEERINSLLNILNGRTSG